MQFKFSIDDSYGAEMKAYAKVKGFARVGDLARHAVVQLMARNPPTPAQKERMAAVMRGEGKEPLALLHSEQAGNLKEA
jgi:hypothetical protein